MKIIAAIIYFVLTITRPVGYSQERPDQPPDPQLQNTYPQRKPYTYTNLLVTGVIDADTIQLSDGRRLRLIGIKPISGSRGTKSPAQDKASQYIQFLKRMIVGKTVDVEIDIQPYDQYGRILGYVFLKDGRQVNAELLRQGYAQPSRTVNDTRYDNYFYRLYKESEDNKRGLWE